MSSTRCTENKKIESGIKPVFIPQEFSRRSSIQLHQACYQLNPHSQWTPPKSWSRPLQGSQNRKNRVALTLTAITMNSASDSQEGNPCAGTTTSRIILRLETYSDFTRAVNAWRFIAWKPCKTRRIVSRLGATMWGNRGATSSCYRAHCASLHGVTGSSSAGTPAARSLEPSVWQTRSHASKWFSTSMRHFAKELRFNVMEV